MWRLLRNAQGTRGPHPGPSSGRNTLSHSCSGQERPPTVRAGLYLLSAGDRVRVSLDQLLERHGLRVRGTGDLETRGQSAGLWHPASCSFSRRLGGMGGRRAALRPPGGADPLFPAREELRAALGGSGTCTHVCPVKSQIPQGKGTPKRGWWGPLPVPGPREGTDTPWLAQPRRRVYPGTVLCFCQTSGFASVLLEPSQSFLSYLL